jgi:hypothetical protein
MILFDTVPLLSDSGGYRTSYVANVASATQIHCAACCRSLSALVFMSEF